MNLVREPDAGNPPVRFDEREVETEHGMRLLRHRPGKPRHGIMPKPTPPRHLSTLPGILQTMLKAMTPHLAESGGPQARIPHLTVDAQ